MPAFVAKLEAGTATLPASASRPGVVNRPLLAEQLGVTVAALQQWILVHSAEMQRLV